MSSTTTPPSSTIALQPISPPKAGFVYEATIGTDVSDGVLDSCARLFSLNYGVWGENAPSYTRTGEQLCMAKLLII